MISQRLATETVHQGPSNPLCCIITQTPPGYNCSPLFLVHTSYGLCTVWAHLPSSHTHAQAYGAHADYNGLPLVAN